MNKKTGQFDKKYIKKKGNFIILNKKKGQFHEYINRRFIQMINRNNK